MDTPSDNAAVHILQYVREKIARVNETKRDKRGHIQLHSFEDERGQFFGIVDLMIHLGHFANRKVAAQQWRNIAKRLTCLATLDYSKMFWRSFALDASKACDCCTVKDFMKHIYPYLNPRTSKGNRQRARHDFRQNMNLCEGCATPAIVEAEIHEKVGKAFSMHGSVLQHKIGPYRIDLYFPTLRLAIECDENGHSQYNEEKEVERTRFITENLRCTWIRYDPYAEDFDIFTLIGRIHAEILGSESRE